MVQILKKSLILVDGSFYLYRAYYAFPSLIDNKGTPTGAIYGFLAMLRSLILKYQPTHIAIIFDMKGKTFRNKLYKNYKLNRQSMPNNLQIQIKPLKTIIKAMGLPLIEVSIVEADDVIGTLARKAEKTGYSVLISTGDKDMIQLITHRVSLINIITNTILDQKEVLDKFGIEPNLMIDFLALMGDSSDNIPGVPGIGKKTAKILLRNFNGLDAVYDNLEKIASMTFRNAGKIAEKLKQNKEVAYLSYQLAKIRTDVKLELTCEQLEIKKPFSKKLLTIFKKYKFKRWITDIETENNHKV